MPYIALRYERGKLYEEVWAEAVTIVAKRYGVNVPVESDPVQAGRACRAHCKSSMRPPRRSKRRRMTGLVAWTSPSLSKAPTRCPPV